MDNPSAVTSSSKNRKRSTAAAASAAVGAGPGVGGAGGKKRSKTTTTAPLFVPGVGGGNNDDEEEDKKRFAEGIISADVGGVGVLAEVTESMEEGGGAEVPVGICPTSPGIGIGLADVGIVKPDPWVKEELAVREMQEPYVDNDPAGLVGGLIAQPEENWPIKPEMVE